MLSISGDYKIQNIFSGILTNFDEEMYAKNFSLREDLFCIKCNSKLKKYNDYECSFYKTRLLLDMHVCEKCKILYELSYIYNKEFSSLKSYIKRNSLFTINNDIQTIN